jgi:hypothetical protein
MEQKAPIHMTKAQQMLDIACETKQHVSVKAWEGSTGNILEYNNWLVSSSSWRKGWHKLINPVSGEIRTVPDIFIFNVNGHPIYL